jgi:hypothetical protein
MGLEPVAIRSTHACRTSDATSGDPICRTVDSSAELRDVSEQFVASREGIREMCMRRRCTLALGMGSSCESRDGTNTLKLYWKRPILPIRREDTLFGLKCSCVIRSRNKSGAPRGRHAR